MTMDEMTKIFFQTHIWDIAETVDDMKAVGRACGYQGFYLEQNLNESLDMTIPQMNQNVIYIITVPTKSILTNKTAFLNAWHHIQMHDSVLHLNEDRLDHLDLATEQTILFVGSSQNLEQRLKQHMGIIPCFTQQTLCLNQFVQYGIDFSNFNVVIHHVDNNKKDLSTYTKLFSLAKRPLFSFKKNNKILLKKPKKVLVCDFKTTSH